VNKKQRCNYLKKRAVKAYNAFNELIEQVYAVRKHGYEWENAKTLDKSSPDYEKTGSEDIDQPIIQASLAQAIKDIGEAAVALHDCKGKMRLKLFKIAVVYYEAIEAWEHVFEMSKIALRFRDEREFFESAMERTKGKKNYNHDVVFDIETLLDQITEVQG